MAKKEEKRKRNKTVTADLEDFKYAIDELKMKLRDARRHIRRKANFNPLWRV